MKTRSYHPNKTLFSVNYISVYIQVVVASNWFLMNLLRLFSSTHKPDCSDCSMSTVLTSTALVAKICRFIWSWVHSRTFSELNALSECSKMFAFVWQQSHSRPVLFICRRIWLTVRQLFLSVLTCVFALVRTVTSQVECSHLKNKILIRWNLLNAIERKTYLWKSYILPLNLSR